MLEKYSLCKFHLFFFHLHSVAETSAINLLEFLGSQVAKASFCGSIILIGHCCPPVVTGYYCTLYSLPEQYFVLYCMLIPKPPIIKSKVNQIVISPFLPLLEMILYRYEAPGCYQWKFSTFSLLFCWKCGFNEKLPFPYKLLLCATPAHVTPICLLSDWCFIVWTQKHVSVIYCSFSNSVVSMSVTNLYNCSVFWKKKKHSMIEREFFLCKCCMIPDCLYCSTILY